MPVFTETSNAARDLRTLPSRARPLPRLTPSPEPQSGAEEKYEVVVVGAGPAGLFLTLLLARYGLSDDSLLCVDAKPGTLKSGQADGLQPRTLEVLKSLGIASEILDDGCHMNEVAFWNPTQKSTSNNGGIERTSFHPDVTVAARYQHEVTIHQGRIERILSENLALYSKRGVERSHRFVDFSIDEGGNPEYPILIEVESIADPLDGHNGPGTRRTLRAKHLVGADGAHSQVRRSMGLKLEGETTDHIWGVVDFVADTNFPDVRKRSAIHSDAGSVMIIPRERIWTGQHLTRLYVQIKEEVAPDPDVASDLQRTNTQLSGSKSGKERRAAITLEYIFEQAQRVFAPYSIQIKAGTEVDWWAAYQIGQRMTPKFSKKGPDSVERVFIVGDACHTHSPKAGQGMNVSMMDSYNLSWKLVHSLHGLTPKTPKGDTDAILASFEYERLTVARQLIDFDSKFSSMFSGQIGADDPKLEGLTHEQFLKVFSDGGGFTSGCGIEYPEGLLIESAKSLSQNPCHGDDYLNGTLKAGRRLLDTQVVRYADANARHLQDDFASTGRYRILVFTAWDILEPAGQSSRALENVCSHLIPSFPVDTIELIVVHPLHPQRFEWTDIPSCIKKFAEMQFHGVGKNDVYSTYGIDPRQGAVTVVRPDGYVGIVAHLAATRRVDAYLRRCLAS